MLIFKVPISLTVNCCKIKKKLIILYVIAVLGHIWISEAVSDHSRQYGKSQQHYQGKTLTLNSSKNLKLRPNFRNVTLKYVTGTFVKLEVSAVIICYSACKDIETEIEGTVLLLSGNPVETEIEGTVLLLSGNPPHISKLNKKLIKYLYRMTDQMEMLLD